MRRLVLLLLFCAVIPKAVAAQEVIVFADSRSLVVSSHREQGLWTYLKVDSGELAVKTSQIAQIRKEGAEAQQSARAAALAVPSPSPASPPPEKPPPAAPPKAAPVPQGNEDDDDQPPSPESQPPPPSRAFSPARAMPPTPGGPPGGPPQKPGGAGAPAGR